MFHTSSDEEIRAGDTTDIYFRRTKRIIETLEQKRVVAEVTASSLPTGYRWAILAGVEEVAHLFSGVPVDVYSMAEGSLFYPNEPVVRIEGYYNDFCELETPLLGLLCQASGITTKSARFRRSAPDKKLLSFGVRRIHPAIAPMVGRSAYIGGADGVSCITAAKLVGQEPMGTMPHALIIYMGDQRAAWKAFDDYCPRGVPRIALVDTYADEKTEALMAAETIKLDGVRLDTPQSRRGDMDAIVKEVRWELGLRGHSIPIFVSGGIDEEAASALSADGFGIGSAVSNAPIIDFAMDLIEIEGKPCAKRGKWGGKKQVYRCPACMRGRVVPDDGKREKQACECGRQMEPKLELLIKDGEVVRSLPKPPEIRRFVLEQLGIVAL